MDKQEIVRVALGMADTSARLAYLENICKGNPELRAEVEGIIAGESNLALSLESVPTLDSNGSSLENASTVQLNPDRHKQMVIGRYVLQQKLGEGGMGEVWVAEQSAPVKRRVALKLIKTGMDSRAVVARFEQERQALALMDHPNIARVYDGGMTPQGQPYFVMELVNGVSLIKFCDTARLDPKERLELFVPICKAVQHAHQKGIVHRDLKPANILVTMVDGKPVPKVIDFGVAKATSGKITDTPMATQFGAVVGTLEYMSPEQAGFSGQDVDTRSDIYSLGVILYELMTGLRPIDAARLKHAALDEMIRIVKEEEPSKPSTRLSADGALPSLAALRRTEPKKLMALLRGELDWVVMKCLEKNRDRRYETANGLVRDIERFLADEMVEARPPSAGYLLQKFLRRNRGKVAAIAAVLMALVCGLVAFAWQANVAKEQRDRAVLAEGETRKRAEELQKVSDFQAKMLLQVNPADAGKRLTADVLSQLDKSLSKTGVSSEEKIRQTQAFSQSWKLISPTDTARNLIDLTILNPAVVAVGQQFKDQPVVDAALRHTLADLYDTLGMPDIAVPLQKQALETRRKYLGEEHKDTLSSINNLGAILQNMGKLEEAEPYLKEVLEKKRRVLGEGHEDTIVAISNLGTQYYYQGKYEETLRYYQESLDKCRTYLGDKNDITLSTLGNMSTVLKALGRLSEAEGFSREALEKQRKLLGEDDPRTIHTLSIISSLLKSQNKLSEAEPVSREVVDKYRRAMGQEHPRTLIAMNECAYVLHMLKKFEEAEPIARESYEKLSRKFGNEQLDTLISLNTFASLLVEMKKHEEAVKYLTPAEPAARSVLINDNTVRLAQFLMYLGKAKTGLREFSTSETKLLETFSLLEKYPGKYKKDRRTCFEALSILYATWHEAEPGKGFDAKATEWKRKAVSIQN